MDQMKRPFASKKHRILPKGVASRFGLAVLALLVACAAPISNEEVPAVAVPTSTEVALPTVTPTPAIYPAEESRDWWNEKILPVVRSFDCEPKEQIVDAYPPEGAIPWSVNAEGDVIQWLKPDFCGQPGDWVVGFFKLGDGWPEEMTEPADSQFAYLNNLIGPDYQLVAISPGMSTLQALGPQTDESLDAIREIYTCMSTSAGFADLKFYPSFGYLASEELAMALKARILEPAEVGPLSFYGQCTQ